MLTGGGPGSVLVDVMNTRGADGFTPPDRERRHRDDADAYSVCSGAGVDLGDVARPRVRYVIRQAARITAPEYSALSLPTSWRAAAGRQASERGHVGNAGRGDSSDTGRNCSTVAAPRRACVRGRRKPHAVLPQGRHLAENSARQRESMRWFHGET